MTASEDGLAGLDLARDEPPDLVLRDLMRPGPDGWVVLGQPKGDALTVGSTWPRDGSHAVRRRGAA
jgi:CheY-like chemotaxis protein